MFNAAGVAALHRRPLTTVDPSDHILHTFKGRVKC